MNSMRIGLNPTSENMATKKTVKLDPYSWEFTQKMIKVGHNRRVKNYFKDIQVDDSKATGRTALKTALLIRNEDSAIETLNKMTYFANYLENDVIASSPEGWLIKRGQDIPQLAIIFRDRDKKSISGNYTLYIPHYNGNRTPIIPTYQKGDHWARWIFKDNSQLLVNGNTESEAIRIIEKLEKFVEPKYQTDKISGLKVGKYTKGTIKNIKVMPIRADFYSKGKTSNIADWRHYF
jgi:hypothetical protein